MDWQDVRSNTELKPKVEVTGTADALLVKIPKDIVDTLRWSPGTARVQFADTGGGAHIRLSRDEQADWQLRSAGKGGGLLFDARQLTPQSPFEAEACPCDIDESCALVVALPRGFVLENPGMIKRRKGAKSASAATSSD